MDKSLVVSLVAEAVSYAFTIAGMIYDFKNYHEVLENEDRQNANKTMLNETLHSTTIQSVNGTNTTDVNGGTICNDLLDFYGNLLFDAEIAKLLFSSCEKTVYPISVIIILARKGKDKKWLDFYSILMKILVAVTECVIVITLYSVAEECLEKEGKNVYPDLLPDLENDVFAGWFGLCGIIISKAFVANASKIKDAGKLLIKCFREGCCKVDCLEGVAVLALLIPVVILVVMNILISVNYSENM